ncbi:hypothetical protein ERJ75_001019500 [Trypanosoma vivax]|nr:hypothetical protein ERJ75_001019500 [Trypanosoma vivax]
MPRWENAIALVCEPNRRVLYSALRHQTDGNARTTHDPSRVKELREALFVLHSACITGQVPWQVAVELFSRANGPPHTMQVFPAFYSEMIIGKCSSWSTALHIFEHSLITVRRPTRVQQLLAQLILQRMRTDPLWNASASRLTPIDTAAGEGRGFISWEVALWLYARLTRKRMEPPIPQRTMIELLRHCVYNREAALSMYDAYWAQGYKRIEGVNPFLSLLRAARVSRCEESALRAMRDYIRCCEERDSVVCVNKSCVVKPHTVTAEGNATLCRSFMSLCLSGVISKRASERVASALRKRGCIGEVEELIIMGAGHGMSGTTGDK